MEPLAVALVALAAFAAGSLNAVAGGGSFLTFPALLGAGVSPIAANATSTVGLWPASLASIAGYRDDLKHPRRELLTFGAVSLAGGILGAVLLLLTPERTFERVIAWLLLGATLIFAAGPGSTRRLRARGLHAPYWLIVAVQLLVGVYGGYFGGGIGILMLASFAALGMTDIHAMNGLKSILASAINGVAALLFVLAGVVDWPYAAVMIASSVAGGYGGARLARRVDVKWIRLMVILIGATLTLAFFWRAYA